MTFTRDDFLDALDLDAFTSLFTQLGFSPVHPGAALHTRVRTGKGGRVHHDTVNLVDRTDEDWRVWITHAARTYTQVAGEMLWWVPRTETEAAYASLIVGLLHTIRTQIESGDGWNGGDVVDCLTTFFSSLSLDLDVVIPGLPGIEAQHDDDRPVDPRMFLAASIAPGQR